MKRIIKEKLMNYSIKEAIVWLQLERGSSVKRALVKSTGVP